MVLIGSKLIMNETNTAQAFHLNNEKLIAHAVKNNEGIIASNGAFATSTGMLPRSIAIVPDSSGSNVLRSKEEEKDVSELGDCRDMKRG